MWRAIIGLLLLIAVVFQSLLHSRVPGPPSQPLDGPGGLRHSHAWSDGVPVKELIVTNKP